MTAQEIIRMKANPAGWPIEQERLADFLLSRVETGYSKVLQYGPVVFTVGTNPLDPAVHMFSADSRACLLHATRQFMRDVWQAVRHQYLVAPLENETIKKIVLRLGWIDTGEDIYNHRIFQIERPA